MKKVLSSQNFNTDLLSKKIKIIVEKFRSQLKNTVVKEKRQLNITDIIEYQEYNK